MLQGRLGVMETVPVGRDKGPGWEEGVGGGVWGRRCVK